MRTAFANNSVLANGTWYKIGTTKQGVYKLTYQNLVDLGLPQPIKSADFRLYGNGGAMLPEANATFRYDDLIENAVYINDNDDGYLNPGDYILFYGQSTTIWDYNAISATFQHTKNLYADTAYYFITLQTGIPKRVSNYPAIAAPADTVLTSFNDYQYHELDSINLLMSGRKWLGEVFNQTTSYDFTCIFPNLDKTKPLQADFSVFARSQQESAFEITLNSNTVSDTLLPIDGNINADYASTKIISLSFVPTTDTLNIHIFYNKPDDAAMTWLDYFEINAKRTLVYDNNQLLFRSLPTLGSTISQFTIQNPATPFRVWLVKNNADINEISLSSLPGASSFKAYTDSLLNFIAFDQNNSYSPILIGSIPNQNLHAISQADLVIVTHPNFILQANSIAEFHRNNDNMIVAVATTPQIYNEFSSGKQDIAAIRDFVRMIYQRGINDTVQRLKYLLLLGDGSYDMKNRISPNSNFIPTWQTDNSVLPTSSFVSDDFFGKLDSLEGGDITIGKLDIGIGRLPVNSAEEATNLVEKIIRYGTTKDLLENSYENGLISNFDPWRNEVCIIADDEDGNLHLRQAEKLCSVLDSLTHTMNIRKIYLDSYNEIHSSSGDTYPDVNDAVNKVIAKGALMINYIGHGGEYGLAGEGILTMGDIGKYTNYYSLPVFVTATCEFSRYDNPNLVSAGEKILLNPNGGGIALFTTTRVAYAHANEIINRNLIKTAFTKNTVEKNRFGDIVKQSKNLCDQSLYMQNFTLLGDPALSMAFPKYKVVTEQIGVDTLKSSSDTLNNSNVVSVSGYISDDSGNKQTGYNGKIYPFVYDKPNEFSTLANDPSVSYVASFQQQQSILYKGNVSVTNGEFSFSFFVPKDISFATGLGKITYYSKNADFDAAGVTDSLCLKNNGIVNNPDILGPDIRLYLNDINFISGENTADNPRLIAFLHDTSGINSCGLSLGHEITAVLDDGLENPFFLNDNYIADLNTYTSGKTYYQFSGLHSGEHKLTLKAWDLLNNSSEKEIYFTVLNPAGIKLGGVYNYPDPVYDYTWFYIEHNLSDAMMFLIIVVYDITGKAVTEIQKNISPDEYKPIEIYWNASDAHGNPLSKGFYTYTVTLSDNTGKIRQRSDKLVIIK
ncbi:MAG: type IX secretion system sortase PorU [Bacteroidota bacterium]